MAASREMNPVSTPRALEAFTLPNPEEPGRPRLMLRIRLHLGVPEEEGSLSCTQQLTTTLPFCLMDSLTRIAAADEPATPWEGTGQTPPLTPGNSKRTKITLRLQR